MEHPAQSSCQAVIARAVIWPRDSEAVIRRRFERGGERPGNRRYPGKLKRMVAECKDDSAKSKIAGNFFTIPAEILSMKSPKLLTFSR